MNITEKLEHFHETVREDSLKEAESILSAHRQSLEEMFTKHKTLQQETAAAEIKAETEYAAKEINKALSSEQLSLKREMNAKNTGLIEKLFAEVLSLLEDFMSSPEYDLYLEKKILEAKAFAGEDAYTIYLSSNDAGRIPALSAKTGVPLFAASDSFLGGIKAEIPARNILIDDSFASSLEKLRKNFKFDGGKTV